MVGRVITLKETEDCGYCTYCEAVCPTGAIRCPFEIIFEEE
jgi:ferredoxin